MKAYHSTFITEEDSINTRVVGNLAILPIRTKFRGPSFPTQADYDIIDEVLDLFRANSFFKNFEIKGPADRTLIYGILYISSALNILNNKIDEHEAVRVLSNLALDHFSIPGDVGFPLNSLYAPPASKQDAELLRAYLQQFRQELSTRLVERIYRDDKSKPSKYWLAFQRKRFMNKSL